MCIVHVFLCAQADLLTFGEKSAQEPSDEAAFRAALREQLGEGRAAFVALIDQLLFYEEQLV